MSGGASFNSSFDVAPMREPIQNTKGEISYHSRWEKDLTFCLLVFRFSFVG